MPGGVLTSRNQFSVPGGRLRRIGHRRHARVDRRVVGHPPGREGGELGPVVAGEPDGVVADAGRRAPHVRQHDEPAHRARRPPDPAQGPLVGAAGRRRRARRRRWRRRPAPSTRPPSATTPVDRRRRRRRSARRRRPCARRRRARLGHPLEREPQLVEPARRVPAAEAGLDVRDARQRRRRPVRRRPGVRGVATGPLHEARIVERRRRQAGAASATGRSPAGRGATACGAAAPIGPVIGPARNVRSLTSQIRRPWSSKRRQAAPAPGLNASNAATRASASSGTTSDEPSGQWYVNCGSRRRIATSSASDVPATRNSSSNTCGNVTQRRAGVERRPAVAHRRPACRPSRRCARARSTRRPGAARRMATARPADAGADDDDVGALSHEPSRGTTARRAASGSIAAPPTAATSAIAEEGGEADRLHHRHRRRTRRRARRSGIAGRQDRLEHRHHGGAGDAATRRSSTAGCPGSDPRRAQRQ